MSAIKAILQEETRRLEQLCRKYRQKIRNLPQGSVSRKERKGNFYSYLAHRDGAKVRFEYLGKAGSPEVVALEGKIAARKKYERLLKHALANLKELRRMTLGKKGRLVP